MNSYLEGSRQRVTVKPRFQQHRVIRRVNIRPRHGQEGRPSPNWTPIEASNAKGSLMMIGPGELFAPTATFSVEHILFHLKGQLTVEVQDKRYGLAEHDQVFIPTLARFALYNTGDTWGSWYSISVRVREWPGRAIQADGTAIAVSSGWPYDDDGCPIDRELAT